MSKRWARADQLARLDGDFDIVVIGGGVVGAGAALDAASRGYRVAQVERSDWASATSSRSTKLLHGGVRYLPHLRFGLIREGLREQKVLARTADYLFAPIDFVIPVFRGRGFADAPRWARGPRVFPLALRVGLWVYDRLGGRQWRVRRRISSREVLERFPHLRTAGLRHGVRYRDASTDDARLTLMLARTATDHGAVAVSYAEATRVKPNDDGFEVKIADRLDGGTRKISAAAVISATGPFAPPGAEGPEPLPLVLSKGAHLVMDAAALGITAGAVVLPETDDDRVIFVVAWQGHAVVGTTDTPYDGDPAHPTTTTDDIDYLVRHLRRYFDEVGPPIAAWSGLRALASGGGSTAKASRAHRIFEPSPGHIRVAGGKLTGYRMIAKQVVDRAAKRIGRRGRCRTHSIPLFGAGPDDVFIRRTLGMADEIGVPGDIAASLCSRYGRQAESILALASADTRLASPLGDRWLAAEVVHAVRQESTATIGDFVQRRTRIAWFTPDHGRSLLAPIGRLMAEELGWDAARLDTETSRAEADLAAESL